MKHKLLSSLLLLGVLAVNAQDLQMLLDSSNIYWENENYKKAFEKLNEAKLETERAYEAGEENSAFNYGYILNEAAIKLLVAEDFEACINFFATAADLFEEADGENSTDRFNALGNLAITYERQGNYFMALFWYDYLLKIEEFRSFKGEQLYQVYNNAGIAAQLSKLRDDAFLMFENSIELLSPEHPDYWTIMENILILDRSFGYGLASEKYQDEFIEKFPERRSEFRNLFAYRFREKAMEVFGEGDYQAAIPFLEKTLEQINPNDSISQLVEIYSTQELTLSLLNTGQYSKAKGYAVKNEELVKNFFGEKTDEYLYALNYLTLVNTEQANYKEAEKVYAKAYRILKNHNSETSGEIKALFDTNYGELLMKQGKYEEAKTYVENAIGFYVKDKAYFDDLIYSLNQSGMILVGLGEYDKAEGLLQRALNFQNEAKGLENEMATKIANNLTVIYMQTGRNSRAIQFTQFILGNDLAIHGEKSFEYSFSLQVAGTLMLSMRLADKAIELLEQSFTIRKNLVDEDNREFLKLKQSLGAAYSEGGQYEKAMPLLEDALEQQLKTLGETHDVALTYNDLGMLQFRTKNYKEAQANFSKALKINREVLGSLNQYTCTNLYNLACISHLLGDRKKSLAYFKEAIANYLHILDEFFPHLSEKERLEYYHTIKGQIGAYFSLLNELLDENPQHGGELFDVQIRTKAMLLNESMQLRNFLDQQDDPKIQETYDRWIEINQEVAKLEQFQNAGAQKMYLDSLKIVGEEYERLLNSLTQNKPKADITWKDIASSLKDGEVAVEIIGIKAFDFENIQWVKSRKQYLALIIDNKTTDFPKYVHLENGADMDSKFFSLYKNNIKFKLTDKASFKNYWEPIASALEGYKKVYFSSDGAYHLINLNTLYNPDTDRYVIEDWNIEIVGNTKELVGRQTEKDAPKKATLFGFPDFNSQASSEVKDTERTSVFREIFTEGVADLPGTKVEVENINSLMTSQGVDTKSFLADQAHEAQLKSIESTDILHIATHGFFEESSEDVINDDPLLHSGLLMANLKETIAPSEENGIITAKEIAQLNLKDNKLVVLSACETGRGKIVDGQGVYGLQRAFQVAGADNVIISLWKVDDEATKELMTLFYQDYLQNHDPRKALKYAQIELKKKFPEPLYWGAFYVVGD